MVLSYANVGATGLFTTASDLARWGLALERGTVGGRPLVERIQETYVLIGGERIDYAFGLSVETQGSARAVRHSGGTPPSGRTSSGSPSRAWRWPSAPTRRRSTPADWR